MVRLDNWSVIYGSGNMYTPPERRSRILTGIAFGHPRFADGEEIETSEITGPSVLRPDGRHVIQTASREYVLGAPSQEYLSWLEESEIDYDPNQPVR